MRNVIIVAALLITLGVSNTARAEASAQQFLDGLSNEHRVQMTSGELLQSVLFGVYQGFLGANSYLVSENRKPFYCPPKRMEMTDQQTVNILKGFVEKNPRYRKKEIGLVLFFALQDTFPCPK